MRALKILALVLVGLAVCGPGKAGAATSVPGVAGPDYDTSPGANARFLADYAARPNVKKLPDGLMYRVLKSGDGPTPQKNSDVATVYYKGMLITDAEFDALAGILIGVLKQHTVPHADIDEFVPAPATRC